jgi:hypothetical protein
MRAARPKSVRRWQAAKKKKRFELLAAVQAKSWPGSSGPVRVIVTTVGR